MALRLVAELLEVIVGDRIPDRPGRREPRAVKLRPKPYPLLNQPRRRFKEIAHRKRYRKNKAWRVHEAPPHYRGFASARSHSP